MVTRLSGRLNNKGVEGQSDGPDKPGPGRHCLLCRHTTDPQSFPSKLASEMERDERKTGRNEKVSGAASTGVKSLQIKLKQEKYRASTADLAKIMFWVVSRRKLDFVC